MTKYRPKKNKTKKKDTRQTSAGYFVICIHWFSLFQRKCSIPTGDTGAADGLTSVTFTNKSLGAVRKHRYIFSSWQALMKAKKTQLIFSCRRLCWHLFSMSASVLSPRVLCNAHLQAGGLICVRVNSGRPLCQSSWEQGFNCLCSFQTVFHQMAPSPL